MIKQWSTDDWWSSMNYAAFPTFSEHPWCDVSNLTLRHHISTAILWTELCELRNGASSLRRILGKRRFAHWVGFNTTFSASYVFFTACWEIFVLYGRFHFQITRRNSHMIYLVLFKNSISQKKSMSCKFYLDFRHNFGWSTFGCGSTSTRIVSRNPSFPWTSLNIHEHQHTYH